MKTLRECLPTIGARRFDIENWIARETLRTKYQETVPGRARLYSRKNILELATIAAFAKVGMPVSTAVAFSEVITDWRLPSQQREWAVLPAGDFSRVTWTDDLASVLGNTAIGNSEAPPVFAAVQTGEIVRRVDRLFEQVEA